MGRHMDASFNLASPHNNSEDVVAWTPAQASNLSIYPESPVGLCWGQLAHTEARVALSSLLLLPMLQLSESTMNNTQHHQLLY